jgi:hypothetical protein
MSSHGKLPIPSERRAPIGNLLFSKIVMRPGPSRIIWKIFIVQNAELTCKSSKTRRRSASIIAPASFGRRRAAAKREIGQRHFPPRPIFLPGFWGNDRFCYFTYEAYYSYRQLVMSRFGKILLYIERPAAQIDDSRCLNCRSRRPRLSPRKRTNSSTERLALHPLTHARLACRLPDRA